jgi:FtsP/CotA-like multicopper oxidase with cupredoxin domain
MGFALNLRHLWVGTIRDHPKEALVMRTAAGVLAILIGALAGPGGAQEPTRSIVLQIIEREVRGSDVDAAAPAAVVRVDQGDLVEIRWSSDEGATVHLHGYDIETVVPLEGEAVMRFVARATGRFPIESHSIGAEHHLEKILLYLEVHPR